MLDLQVFEKLIHTGRFTRQASQTMVLLLSLAASVSAIRAQETGQPATATTIYGAILSEEDDQPLANTKVEIQASAGGAVVTSFTDPAGNFQAATRFSDSYVIVVTHPGCQPVQRDVPREATASRLLIFLRASAAAQPLPLDSNNFVSLRDLKIPNKARRQFDKGVQHLTKKDPAGSLDAFRKAIQDFPAYHEAYLEMALADMLLHRGDDAQAALQRALDLTGGRDAKPHFALGLLLCERGNFGDAERIVRRGLELDPTSWRGHLALGQVLFDAKRFEEAEREAQEAAIRKPDLSVAYLILANVHLHKRNYAMVLKDLDAFLKLEPRGATSDVARAIRAASQRFLNERSRVPLESEVGEPRS